MNGLHIRPTPNSPSVTAMQYEIKNHGVHPSLGGASSKNENFLLQNDVIVTEETSMKIYRKWPPPTIHVLADECVSDEEID